MNQAYIFSEISISRNGGSDMFHDVCNVPTTTKTRGKRIQYVTPYRWCTRRQTLAHCDLASKLTLKSTCYSPEYPVFRESRTPRNKYKLQHSSFAQSHRAALSCKGALGEPTHQVWFFPPPSSQGLNDNFLPRRLTPNAYVYSRGARETHSNENIEYYFNSKKTV